MFCSDLSEPGRAEAKRSDAGRTLDFIIIGAQKSGTTSLYKYLQPHPSIYMLPEKEAPFFSAEALYSRGWEWYRQEFFSQAPPERIWGKATPMYMANLQVPERIHELM